MATTLTRTAFAVALHNAITEAEVTHADLADTLGVATSGISQWTTSRATPSPDTVFRIEEALGLKPGTLSKTLGYLPVNARQILTVPQAVDLDDQLTPLGRRLLLSAYRELVRG